MESSAIQRLTSWRFNRETDAWVPATDAPENITATELTVATYNVWFAEFWFRERCRAWLGIVKNCHADAIAVQEITPDSLALILQQDWVRENYFISDITGETVDPYGVVLLSRFPLHNLSLHRLPSTMYRQLIFADIFLNGHPLKLASVHLESQKSSTAIRAEQLSLIFPQLETAPAAILMGDFNFCATWSENDHLDPRYVDLWAKLRPGEAGYTEDTDINLMRLEQKGKEKQVRFDRILLHTTKSAIWQPQSIELLGTKPIFPHNPHVFPSDHFGLVARLSLPG